MNENDKITLYGVTVDRVIITPRVVSPQEKLDNGTQRTISLVERWEQQRLFNE